jgi:hypothetical protein
MKALEPAWQLVSDQVMGGVSAGTLSVEDAPQGRAHHMSGRVSLDNNGGFIQMAADIAPPPPGTKGLMLDVSGNGEQYNVHLRTSDLDRPWQSYRASFIAPDDRQEIRLDLADFEPHRTDEPFNPAKLRRIGIVAIGREFDADVWLYSIAWY